MIQKASLSPHSEKFDAVIVDEAQDFGENWWVAATELLKDKTDGGLYAFGDLGQGIFNRSGTTELGFVPLRLHKNLRNAEPIADAANYLTDTPAPAAGLAGPEIRFVQVPEDADENEIIYAADDVVEYLRDDYGPQHVALLTTKSRHPVHRELAGRDPDAYLKTLWKTDDIFYGTVSGFKGLERNCVILTVNGFHDEVDPKRLLYVGMTRARDFLVVVAKKSELAAVLDPELMTTLNNEVIHLESDA